MKTDPPKSDPQKRKIFERKHPLAIRWFHWVNFPILFIMIWSGLLIYWANDVYHVGPFHFFPENIYNLLGMPGRLAEGMAWHFAFMWIFFINGICYVSYVMLSGEWRVLLPNRASFRHAWQTVLYDLKIRKLPPAAQKFNGAQQFTYTGVVLMGMGSLLTGAAIYKPIELAPLTAVLGGYELARVEHFILTVCYVLFFVVHIAQVVRAGWNNFRAMITGYEIKKHDTPLRQQTEDRIKSITRRHFIWFGSTGVAALGGWYWLRTALPVDDLQWPLRRMLEGNEALTHLLFKPFKLAPTFSRHLAKEPRINGLEGMEDAEDSEDGEDFKGEKDLSVAWDPTSWKLKVVHGDTLASSVSLGEVTLATLLSLPHTEMVTELKCIEGWSEIVEWAGVRFSDFVAHFAQQWNVDVKSFAYVSLVTPDGGYFVGMDMASMLHPQTLLCYEMNGKTLTLQHGYPLRLAAPLKYGIKNIKRIASIRFTNSRPDDYWALQGYDWFAGH